LIAQEQQVPLGFLPTAILAVQPPAMLELGLLEPLDQQ